MIRQLLSIIRYPGPATDRPLSPGIWLPHLTVLAGFTAAPDVGEHVSYVLREVGRGEVRSDDVQDRLPTIAATDVSRNGDESSQARAVGEDSHTPCGRDNGGGVGAPELTPKKRADRRQGQSCEAGHLRSAGDGEGRAVWRWLS